MNVHLSSATVRNSSQLYWSIVKYVFVLHNIMTFYLQRGHPETEKIKFVSFENRIRTPRVGNQVNWEKHIFFKIVIKLSEA